MKQAIHFLYLLNSFDSIKMIHGSWYKWASGAKGEAYPFPTIPATFPPPQCLVFEGNTACTY